MATYLLPIFCLNWSTEQRNKVNLKSKAVQNSFRAWKCLVLQPDAKLEKYSSIQDINLMYCFREINRRKDV